MPRFFAFVLLTLGALTLAGCYSTHRRDGDTDCGAETCVGSQLCCRTDCAGGMGCVDAIFECPDLDCPGDCFGDFDCSGGSVCITPTGTCGGAGSCVDVTDDCSRDCPVVCGCDGNDYCNECIANRNGISIQSGGSCSGELCGGVSCGAGQQCCEDCMGGEFCLSGALECPVCPEGCTSNFECAPTEYCQFDDFACGGIGSCEIRPTICDDFCTGVCGCDGTPYCNRCFAANLGVNVAPPDFCGMMAVGTSCLEIQALDPGAPDGVYTLIGAGGEPVAVYCDMTTDGGGWTLVASTRFQPLDDAAIPYHPGLAQREPFMPAPGVWDGMRGTVAPRSDVRFTCRQGGAATEDVDLSFYDVIWYAEWTTGTDAQSCFSEGNGMGADFPEPARRNNLTGQVLMIGTPWTGGVGPGPGPGPGRGFLEGEDSCDDDGDFTVDFQDRGMDSNEMDGTDWGEDDNNPKCGSTSLMDGIWQIWVR